MFNKKPNFTFFLFFCLAREVYKLKFLARLKISLGIADILFVYSSPTVLKNVIYYIIMTDPNNTINQHHFKKYVI